MMHQPAPSTLAEHAVYYVSALGWALTQLRPHSKAPMLVEWNSPLAAVRTPEAAQALWGAGQAHGMGLVHAHSGTGAFDVDSLEWAAVAFAEFGIEFNELLEDAPRIAGRDGRDKIIFRVPAELELATVKLVWPKPAPDAKPVTVFELRAGTVQDVLPPSIHPDTGAPYRWVRAPWEFDEIPMAPRELLEIWRTWKTFRPQFEAACPWAEKPAAPRPVVRQISRAHGNVIGQFNAVHGIEQMLERHGYQRRAGRRWLAPSSSSGIPGVALLDGGRCFSHHASDVLNDGHSHDAFDVFCLLEHAGDFARAVRAAARELQIERPCEAAPNVDLTPLLERGTPVAAAPAPAPASLGTPAELLSIPGVLGEVACWIEATAQRPQPQLSVQGAIAFGCAVLGRRFITDRRNWPTLYLLNLAKSAAGKDWAKKAAERLLEFCGQDARIGPAWYHSPSAVFSALKAAPAHLAVCDEFGKVLDEAKASTGRAGSKSLVPTTLVRAWSECDGTLRQDSYSDASATREQRDELRNRSIRNPALSLLALSTPDVFYASLSIGAVRDGFLNRFLIVESSVGRQLARDVEYFDPPESIRQWATRQVPQATEGANLAGVEPGFDLPGNPRVIPFSAAARELVRAFDADCIARMDALDRDGLSELYGRACEIAMRLALVVSRSLDEAEISSTAAAWAIGYVRHYTEATVAAVATEVAGSEFGRLCKKTLAAIAKLNSRGETCTRSRLVNRCRELQDIEDFRVDNVIAALVTRGAVQVDATRKSGPVYTMTSQEAEK